MIHDHMAAFMLLETVFLQLCSGHGEVLLIPDSYA